MATKADGCKRGGVRHAPPAQLGTALPDSAERSKGPWYRLPRDQQKNTHGAALLEIPTDKSGPSRGPPGASSPRPSLPFRWTRGQRGHQGITACLRRQEQQQRQQCRKGVQPMQEMRGAGVDEYDK